MTVSLPSRQRAGYCDIPSPFALDDEAFRALGHPPVDTLEASLGALPDRGAERPAQDRRAEELECAI